MAGKNTNEIDWQSQDPAAVVYKIGIYGWRKRCIYFLILLILVVTVINLSLTIWIIRVMDYNWDGMGKLRITDKGVKLYGNAEFVKSLHAKEIRARQNSPLLMQSTANVTVNTRDEKGNILGQLFLGNDEFVVQSKRLQIKTGQGKRILYADKDKILFEAGLLEFESRGGAKFNGSVEAQTVRSPPRKHLKLESLTRSLYMNAPEGITLESKVGSMNMTSLKDIVIKSETGKVILEANSVVFKNLLSASGSVLKPDPNARDVCVCKDGTMFLATDAEEATTIINKEQPELKIQIIPENSFISHNIEENRVRIFVDKKRRVVNIPHIG